MVIGNNFYNNVKKVSNTNIPPLKEQTIKNGDAFGKVLQDVLERSEGLKFSKHAESRLQARNINLSQAQKTRIDEGVKKAEAKGIKDSLVLMDNIAFVVNVKNKTVITAVNSSELKDNVFTNIDGAVIV